MKRNNKQGNQHIITGAKDDQSTLYNYRKLIIL